MSKMNIFVDVIWTRTLTVEVPEDATREDVQRIIDENAEMAFAQMREETNGKLGDWYWSWENVETETA